MHMPRRPGTPTSVTGRVLAILDAFGPGDRLSCSEISRRSGLPVATTFRLVKELLAGGALACDADLRYRIGPLVRGLLAA